MHRSMLPSILRSTLRPLRTACLAAALSLAATGAFAVPVMTFTANHATTGIEDATSTVYSDSSFWETGVRFNIVQTLRDEVVVENGMQTTFHYRDVTYDVQGHWRDAAHIDLDVTPTGAHTAQFYAIGSLVPGQSSRLVDGNLDFTANLYLAGDYVAGEVPGYPGLLQPPPPPVFADMSSGTPAQLAGSVSYAPDGSFYGNTVHAFTATRGQAYYDYSYLLYGNGDLLTSRIAFTLFGPGYDEEVRSLGYTQLLGTDVVAVPEPAAWTMLLAGAGVLALARHMRTAGAPFFGRGARTALRST